MLSNDKNIETIHDLILEVKEYLALQKDLLQLGVVEKVVRLLSALVLTVVLAFFLLLIIIFLSFAAAHGLALLVPTPLAFLVVAGVYVCLFCLVYAKRRTWIERPLVKTFADILTA